MFLRIWMLWLAVALAQAGGPGVACGDDIFAGEPVDLRDNIGMDTFDRLASQAPQHEPPGQNDLRDGPEGTFETFNRMAGQAYQAAGPGPWQQICLEFMRLTGHNNDLVRIQQDAYGYPTARLGQKAFGGDQVFMIKLASLLPERLRNPILQEALQTADNPFANPDSAEYRLGDIMLSLNHEPIRRLVLQSRAHKQARQQAMEKSYRSWQENNIAQNERRAQDLARRNRQTEQYHKTMRDREEAFGDIDMQSGNDDDAADHYEAARQHQELYGRNEPE